MLVTVYNHTRGDLSQIGGPKEATLLDSLAVEVDIQTNDTVFVWSALEHVSLEESYYPTTGPASPSFNATDPYDFFHINSIQPWADAFLINARHTLIQLSYFLYLFLYPDIVSNSLGL